MPPSSADPDRPVRSVETQTLTLKSTTGTQTPRIWENRWQSGAFFTCASCGSVFVHEQSPQTPAAHVCKDGKTKCRFCKCSCDKADDEIVGTEDRPHVCNVCSKGFTRKVSLERHVKTIHQGRRDHVCAVCGMKFQQKITLKRHQTTHTKEKAYGCDWCGKTFAQPDHLRNHLRTHTREKPYCCSDCGGRFTQKSHLHKHVVHMHTRHFPHNCLLCGRGFYLPVHLRRHMQSAHKDWSERALLGE